MRVAVTGSIATDHLMTFPGRYSEVLLPDQLANISISVLVDDLVVRRGGVGANIAFGMGVLGLEPLLVGAVGADFGDYRVWLDRHGVDTSKVHVSEVAQTARFVCTTDADQNQIASFYPGAMSEAREIELASLGELDLVIVGPNDPDAMLRYTQDCRTAAIPFVADPSQQLASMGGDVIRDLIDGAAYLFTNEYEAALTESKTGWSSDEILDRVGTRVTTLGAKGAKVERKGEPDIVITVAGVDTIAEPTGVGDAFRAGYVAGIGWGLGAERCAQVGATLAAYVIETVGTQEYEIGKAHFLERLGAAYGPEAAADVEPHLVTQRP